MNVNYFFNFSSKYISSSVQAHPIGLGKNEVGVDHESCLVFGEYQGIEFPVVFEQEYGKNLTDILDTGWVSLYLISDRFKGVLEENHLTGWKTFPIKLYDKKKNEITGYQGLSITGHSGPPDYTKCEIVEKRHVPEGPLCRYYRGYYIDDWDATDFFIPNNTRKIVVTRKVNEVIKKNKITNLHLENLAEVEINVRDVKNAK